MKQFISYIALWVALPSLSLLFLFGVDVPPAYRYNFIRNEGCQINWIQQRIADTSMPIQAAFLGASHTGCGIQDQLINEELGLPAGSIANLSYCLGQRNIHIPILEELLKHHKPKFVVVDIHRIEPEGSHKDFGVIANSDRVFGAPFLWNDGYFRDIFKYWQVRFFYLQDKLFGRVFRLSENTLPYTDYSYRFIPLNEISDDDARRFLDDEREKNESDLELSFFKRKKQEQSLDYVEELVELCSEHDVPVVFLYLPAYGMVNEKPIHYDWYASRSEVLIPPKSIFEDQSLWFDQWHLNYNGSKKLSEWLTGELRDYAYE